MVRAWVDGGLWVAAVMWDRKSDSEDSAPFLVRNNALKIQCEQISALILELSLIGDYMHFSQAQSLDRLRS